MSTRPHRVVLYSHDSLGLGHMRRNLAIAHHLGRTLPLPTGRRATGLLVSGLPLAHSFPVPDGFDWLVLPGLTKGPAGYVPRRLGVAMEDFVALRSHLLEQVLLTFAPDLVIVDRHIYGVGNELRRPLRRLKRARPDAKVVLGLREVLDAPAACAAEWEAVGDPDVLRRIVDEVWVYGDPRVHDPFGTGEVPAVLRDRAHFTGYLAHGRAATDRPVGLPGGPFVLTTVGGGSDGHTLLREAARMTPPADHGHVIVAGPECADDEYRALCAHAPRGTVIHRTLPGLGEHVRAASAVISMGGYNTVAEILATTTPALILPRRTPRTEQAIRADALAGVGALDVLDAGDLSAARLSRWADEAVHRHVDRSGIARDGLVTLGRRATSLLTRPDDATTGGAR